MNTPSPSQWDAFVSNHPRAHALQLAAWGTLKSAFGWSSALVALTDGETIRAGAQLLFRRLPFRLGTMAYLPFAPLIAAGHDSCQTELWAAIHRTAKQHRAAFLKWEPGLFDTDAPNPTAFGFRASAQTVQPPNTILIDLNGTDDAILARMNQGARRKIRQSQKGGVHYWQAPRADLAVFSGLMQTTGTRNNFGVHDAAYYERAYDLFVPSGHAALMLAEHEGTPLAGVMVFALGKSAWYLYGASSNDKRDLMASYGVQWAALQWAKARECTTYDMWGIPDADAATLEAQFESRSDGLWGVYGFKRGWGGRVQRSLGAWDYVYNPLIYAGYQWYLKRREVSE